MKVRGAFCSRQSSILYDFADRPKKQRMFERAYALSRAWHAFDALRRVRNRGG